MAVSFREGSPVYSVPSWEDPHLGCQDAKIFTAEAVASSMRTVLFGTGIPTACALMMQFWKDMRVGKPQQLHEIGIWMDLGEGFFAVHGDLRRKNGPKKNRVFRVGPGGAMVPSAGMRLPSVPDFCRGDFT